MKANPGVTLSEYALIGTVLVFACIGSLTLLGTSVNQIFSAMLSHHPSSPNAGTVSLTSPATNSSGAALTSPLASTGAAGGPGAPAIPQTLLKSVQTMGTNGTSELLANNLQQLATTLQQDGKLTDEQANILTQLANQGHRLAEGEKILEDAIASGKTATEIQNMQILWGNQTYTGDRFINNVIGFGTWSGDALNTTASNPETKTFLDLYQQAKASGALADDTTYNAVTDLVSQISLLSEAGQNAAYDFTFHTGSYSSNLQAEMTKLAPASAPIATVSQPTHQNSARICHTGPGQDNGARCQGN